MEHYGLTVSAFADNIGVQRSSVSHLLNGRNRPSLDFVMKLVEAYPEVNLYWLLNGNGSFPDEAERKDAPTPVANNLDEISLQKPKPPRTSSNGNSISQKTDIQKIVMFYADGTFESFDVKK